MRLNASSFSSRIESLNELETAYLKEINTLLSGISAWPWFVDYWFDHPDSIKPGDVTLKAIDNRIKPVIRELGTDPEDGLGLDIILELSPEETGYLEEPYVPHPLAGVMAQNKPAAAKEKHVWSTGDQKIGK